MTRHKTIKQRALYAYVCLRLFGLLIVAAVVSRFGEDAIERVKPWANQEMDRIDRLERMT